MSAADPRTFVSIEAAATYLRVRPRTLRIWMNRGLIQSSLWTEKHGWSIPLESLLAFAFEKPNPIDDWEES